MFAITSAGLAALEAWLERPDSVPTELRDRGLLQLFFMDLASDDARLRLAQAQLAIHQAKLAAYEGDARFERRIGPVAAGLRTVEHWRGATLPMGLLYERAAVAFWSSVADDAAASDVDGGQGRSESAQASSG
jgi:hypothetical protein